MAAERVAHMPPRGLAQLVMRHALAAAALCLLLGALLGLWRAQADTRREMQAAHELALLHKSISSLHGVPAREAPGLIAQWAQQEPGLKLNQLRHLRLHLLDEGGAVVAVFGQASPGDEEAGFGPVAALGRAVQWLNEGGESGESGESGEGAERGGRAAQTGGSTASPVRYAVPLADGRRLTAVLTPTAASEVQEAAGNLATLLALMALCAAALLAAMHWNVRRALRPLQTLVAAIGGVQRQELAAVQALPPMPVQELETIAGALRQLAQGQATSQAQQRLLAQRLMSLQEDERQRLAHDLHDEFGQRLTALRVDAAWLERRLSADATAHGVVQGMLAQIEQVQGDVRRLLVRLRPLSDAALQRAGRGEPGELGERMDKAGAGPAARVSLSALLADLVSAWQSAGRASGLSIHLNVSSEVDAVDWRGPERQALLLGLYRITQEALTNVVRHAKASQCEVSVSVGAANPQGDARAVSGKLRWQVKDNGQGLPDEDQAMRRGSGLAGIKERIWALGGHWQLIASPGLALQAEFALPASIPQTLPPVLPPHAQPLSSPASPTASSTCSAPPAHG